MTVCAWRRMTLGGRTIEKCRVPAAVGSMFCVDCLAKAMARMQTVRNDQPRPWSGVVRASQLDRAKRGP